MLFLNMEITFFGTSQAVPDKERNQSSILLSYNSENILLDCGEGTQRQMKIAKFNACKLTKLLITHWHGDHILGLPGLLQTLALNNYSKTLQVYGPKGTKKFFDLIMSIFIFRDKIKVQVNEIENGKFFENKDFILISAKMDHSSNCVAYSFTEKDKRRIKMNELKKIGVKEGPWIKQLQEGKNINHKNKKVLVSKYTELIKGKKISFIFDTAYNENCAKLVKDSDLLISEACFLGMHKELADERKHLTAEQTAKIAKQAKVKKLIVTHISQRYPNKKVILDEVKKTFKNSELAHDFMNIKL